jgi:hypothetical protein
MEASFCQVIILAKNLLSLSHNYIRREICQYGQCGGDYFLDQRVIAANLAISLRFLAESFFALAGPPFKPPRWPRATAAGFFSVGCSGGFSSVASIAIWKANSLTSDDLFLVSKVKV